MSIILHKSQSNLINKHSYSYLIKNLRLCLCNLLKKNIYIKKKHEDSNLDHSNFFFFFFFFLAMLCCLWNVSSQTRDWTQAPSSEGAESLLPDRQRIPQDHSNFRPHILSTDPVSVNVGSLWLQPYNVHLKQNKTSISKTGQCPSCHLK